MAKLSGINKKVTNHSLRVYGSTHMFKQRVPEKLIQLWSRHHSVEGVQQYERSQKNSRQKCPSLWLY